METVSSVTVTESGLSSGGVLRMKFSVRVLTLFMRPQEVSVRVTDTPDCCVYVCHYACLNNLGMFVILRHTDLNFPYTSSVYAIV